MNTPLTILAVTVSAGLGPGGLDCSPEDGLVSPCPPEVASGRLVANFVAVPEFLQLAGDQVVAWSAANDPSIVLDAGGSPAANIVFDPEGLGGHGMLAVNDFAGDNRHLVGSLGGERLGDCTILWLGHFAPGRDGTLGDASGQYLYAFGRAGGDGSQLDNQIDDGRFEIYGGAATQTGRDIGYLDGHDSVWMTRYFAAPTTVGHHAEVNGIDLQVPGNTTGYDAGGTAPGADDLLLFGWQDGRGTPSGYNFVGDLHQILIYDGVLDSNDTAAVVNYLASKLQEEPPGPGDPLPTVTRVVDITGVNGAANDAPDIYFPHGDPELTGRATFVLDPNDHTMDFEIVLDDPRFVVTQAHMYSPHHKPNGDSIFCWGGRWSNHDFLVGEDYVVHGSSLQEMIDIPERWTLVVHTEGGHFALDEAGRLIPYDAALHETSVSGQVESGTRFNNRVPRRLDDRRLRERNPHSGAFGDPAFDSVYPDPDHFEREHDTPFPDAAGRQWIEWNRRSGSWVPSAHGAAQGLTVEAIEQTDFLFLRYDDQGPSWDYGGPEGAGGGRVRVPDPCDGDVDGDGVVDGLDLAVLITAWGRCPDPANCVADVDGDGVVDGDDLGLVLTSWGACP